MIKHDMEKFFIVDNAEPMRLRHSSVTFKDAEVDADAMANELLEDADEGEEIIVGIYKLVAVLHTVKKVESKKEFLK